MSIERVGDAPLGPRRLNLGGLPDKDFELLCLLVVLLEYRDAVKLSNPDYGADAALPRGTTREYVRCWQFKRFPQNIHWAKCKESLDRAVDHYGMPHYTFCFPRDLTGPQERLFREHLVGRHKGVIVGYWNESRLVFALLGSAQGERITRYFYGDPVADARLLAQAVRAVGELTTGAHALERLQAIGEYLARHDPFFSYPASVREVGLPASPPRPDALMAVEHAVGPDVIELIEAVPRNQEALERFAPRFTFSFPTTEEGRAAFSEFERLILEGGEVTLRGVGFEITNLPPLFEALKPDEAPDEITVVGGPAMPLPWDARFIARTSGVHLDIDLEPVTPPLDWHGALEGSRGGLTATVLLRRQEGRGEAMVNWRYLEQRDAISDQARALALLHAVYHGEPLAIEDRAEERRTLTFLPEATPIPKALPGLLKLMQDVATIEEWTGRTFRLPDKIDREQLRGIAETAYIIRRRQSRMRFDHVGMNFDPAKYEAFAADPTSPLRLELIFGINLFGERIMIGKLVGDLKDVAIVGTEYAEEHGVAVVRARIVPTSEEARNPVFALLPLDE